MARSNGTRWPFGVSARYSNLAGATVDVSGTVLASWSCGGCRTRSQMSPTLRAEEARRDAQAHALQCSAMPRP